MTSPTRVGDLTDLPELGPRRDLGIEERRRLLAQAAESGWLARNQFGHAILHFGDAHNFLRDRRWVSASGLMAGLGGVTDEKFLRRRRLSVLAIEGPEHDRLRRLVAPSFSPAAVERIRPRMRSVAEDLVERMDADDPVDAVAELCAPFAVSAICVMLDLPPDNWSRFAGWAATILKVFDADVAAHVESITRAEDELDAYVAGLLSDRSSLPGNDLLSSLAGSTESDDALVDDEVASLVAALIVAGIDTVECQMASAIAVLAPDAPQWTRIGVDDEYARAVVDEAVRHIGAVRTTIRIASEDVVYRDVLFPAGSLVSVSLASANADPAVFPEATRFAPQQAATRPHLGFGSGAHHCLGASLARVEIHEGLATLARRRPDLSLVGEPRWRPGTATIFGPESMLIRPGRLAPL